MPPRRDGSRANIRRPVRQTSRDKGDPSMADEAVTVREINWREAFPFTHLFRAFRIAIHPSKLIIALVALGCLWCGGLFLDLLWPHKYQVTTADRIALVTAQPGRSVESERTRLALRTMAE